jgi:hypothetical protein
VPIVPDQNIRQIRLQIVYLKVVAVFGYIFRTSGLDMNTKIIGDIK